MTQESLKQHSDYDKLAKFCGALSNPRRISLLVEVASNQNCIKDAFVEVQGLNKFSVNVNLKYMKKFGMINGTFTSRQLKYCINYERLEEFKSLFDDFYNKMKENKESVGLSDQNCLKK